MNMIQRQIMQGMLYSLSLTVLIVLAFTFVFPVDLMRELWDRNTMGLPFIVFIPLCSAVIGAIAGGVSGYYTRQQFVKISRDLSDMELGKYVNIAGSSTIQEVNSIYDRIDRLQKQMANQIATSQKLANERSEEQEKRIQEIVSQERNRLARELHDSVSQQLFAASMLMSAINESEHGEQQDKQLKLVENIIQQSQLEMRALLLHLRPVPLKGKSLKEGMEELLVELMQKVPMKITWKIESVELDKGVEDQLFRILQESLSNTLRHSQASSLEVYLVKREGMVIMIVSDDGVGFDLETSRTGSYGLQNMHERALEVGGTFKIVSVKNKGTRLEVKVPIIVKDDRHEN
ncbi:sensor histidine kinase [Bacillus sp. AGMB 02131]|uniref:Sensor histidine kinase n=1 Tax=Peribacillus faecalis TaxID=2772559 RepID=A0A927CSE3_9BACI|nr:sensor histidine kinase [Peribacillus faecalis]MBD3107028.1 sensor histidine kinase [Peribacillus faecalis]